MGLVLLHVVMPHRLLRSRLKQKTEGKNVRSLYVVANPKKRNVKASNLVPGSSSAVQLSCVKANNLVSSILLRILVSPSPIIPTVDVSLQLLIPLSLSLQ